MTSFKDSKAFCVRPWQQLGILPSGKARFCCLSSRLIRDDAGAVSIHGEYLDQIWNARSIRDVRRKMLAEEMPEECAGCYRAENETGHSPRIQINKDFGDGFLNPSRERVEDFVARVTKADGTCAVLPVDLDLEMNNTCNLACRMCSPDYSSKIETDAVQNKWRPRTAKAAKPDAHEWELLPAFLSGVDYVSVGEQKTDEVGVYVTAFNWGRANFRSERPVRSLKVDCSFDERFAWKVHLKVGGRYFKQTLRQGVTEIELPPHSEAGNCQVLFKVYRRFRGQDVPSGDSAPKVRCYSMNVRFSSNGGKRSSTIRSWAGKRGTTALSIIDTTTDVRRVQLMGGEPLLLKETMDVLDSLISSGRAERLVLSLVTNGTIWSDRIAEKISKFKTAIITVSLDGVGEIYDYIRYGANWVDVASNIRKINALPNTKVWLGPTIQIYNFRHIPEIVNFARAENLFIRATWLRHPRYLSVFVLPSRMKRRMFDELTTFAQILAKEDAPDRYRLFVRGITKEIEQAMGREADRGALDQFILYTNDLDASRGQSFRANHTEQIAELEREGILWHDGTRHLNPPVTEAEVPSSMRDSLLYGARWLRLRLPAKI